MVRTFLGGVSEENTPSEAHIYTLEELIAHIDPIKIFKSKDELYKDLLHLYYALRETSSPKMGDEILRELQKSPEKIRDKLHKLFVNSVGKGHTAAQDLVSVPTELIIPRFMTLLLTDNSYSSIGILQRSTRRVEHDSYFLPKSIEENKELSSKVKDYYEKVQGLFNDILRRYDKYGRKSMRELAMYIQPLALLTSAHYEFDWRNLSLLLYTLGVDRDDKNREQDFLSEYGHSIKDKLNGLDEFLTKDFGQNFNPRLMFSSNGLIYGSDAKDFIKYLGNSKVSVSNVNIPPHLNNKFSDLSSIINALANPEDREKFENVKNTLKGLSIEVYFETDLSLLHELFRHRTVNYMVPSLKSTVEYAIEKGAIENEDILSSLLTIPPQLNEFSERILDIYKESLSLYKELVNNGIPINDALLVIPHGFKIPVYMKMDGWNLYKLFGDRLCSTAKVSMRSLMSSIRTELAEYVKEHNLPHIELLAQPKCFWEKECPEGRGGSCPQKNLIGGYKRYS